MKESLDLLIQLYEYLTKQIVQITRRVVALCCEKKYHERIKLLCTAPGIGKLTAIELLVELQDMARFKSASQLASYIGLTPAEYFTGKKRGKGGLPGAAINGFEHTWWKAPGFSLRRTRGSVRSISN
jgi:transposase